jgi:hypothetical protein
MPKIRKQPKRLGKKLRVQSLRNPFFQESLSFLPATMASNLKSLERIVLQHIDDLICEPSEPPEVNLECMREALYQQELKLSTLKYAAASSKKTKSITQDEANLPRPDHSSSNEDLEAPVKIDSLNWIMHSSEEVNFF